MATLSYADTWNAGFHLRETLLHLIDAGSDINQIASGIQPAKQSTSNIEVGQRVLPPAHRVIEQRHLPGHFGLAQNGPRAGCQLHGAPEPRLRQRIAARLSVSAADDS